MNPRQKERERKRKNERKKERKLLVSSEDPGKN